MNVLFTFEWNQLISEILVISSPISMSHQRCITGSNLFQITFAVQPLMTWDHPYFLRLKIELFVKRGKKQCHFFKPYHLSGLTHIRVVDMTLMNLNAFCAAHVHCFAAFSPKEFWFQLITLKKSQNKNSDTSLFPTKH